ncbi:MAG: hypothetical protein KGM24_03085 [Elusimicrobia bacterium]|nr:hypothetical protein [Elusimicrobiota bacterium]
MRRSLLALTVFLAGAAPALAAKERASAADKRSVELAEYFLKVPTAQADPRFVEPFLKLDPDSLPRRLRARTRAKQIDIRALIRIHETRKKGLFLMPASCDLATFVHPFSEEKSFAMAGYGPLAEDEEQYLMNRTKCTELDMGCEFTLEIFFDKNDKKKKRHLRMHWKDPLRALLIQYHAGAKTNQTNFFGASLTCEH